MNDLTCAEAEPLLPLVADGALDAEGDPALFSHLAQCADCQAALARHDLISLALGQAVSAPAAQPLAVRYYRLPRRWAFAAAAALIASVALGAWSLRPGAPVAQPLAAQTLLHVRVPGQSEPQELILIQQGGASVLVDPAELDRLRDAAQPVPDANARPVRQRW